MNKILFMGGHTGDGLMKNKLPEDGLNFISKPVEPDELLVKI